MTRRATVSHQPTAHELEVFAACLRLGSSKAAAHAYGITENTVKNLLSGLYAKLDVPCASQAAIALGWLTVPDTVTFLPVAASG